MCGIAGLIDLQLRAIDRDRLRAMTELLGHRGPDFSAILVDRDIGLGHTRLSILDVSDHANQPMRSSDGRFAIVYNGELYNFREIRSELEGVGYHFRTSSDTEVILYAYVHWGEDCLHRFNGMFAFVIADLVQRKLFGARDRFGIKPLHYASSAGQFLFASEIKAILRGAQGAFAAAPLKLVELLVYRELIRDTLIRDIRTLPPGHSLKLDLSGPGAVVEEQWFHIEDLPDESLAQELGRLGKRGRLDALEKVIEASVSRHLISDVPVGTLCSGGLDSSLLTAMACRTRPDTTVYHVDIADASEKPWAETVAKHLGIELKYVRLERTNFLADYIECIYFNDYPLTHASTVPAFHVSDLARQHGCKVLLSGEGADELFGGYNWRYRLKYNYLTLGRFFRFLNKVLARIEGMVTDLWTGPFNEAYSFKSRAWIPDVVHLVADQNFRNNLTERCEAAYRHISHPAERAVNAALLSDLWDYVYGILHHQDRASMQASIECRVPFLDLEVARFASNLPISDKFNRTESKLLLKELGTRYLPRDVVYREKMGFGTPGDEYIKSLPTAMFHGGILQTEYGMQPEQLVAAVKRDPENLGQMLYGLEIWGRMFLWGQSPANVKEQWIPTL